MARRYLSEFDKGSHNVHLLYYHLVIVTKYRQHLLDEYACNRVICLFRILGRRYNINVEQAKGESDHIHFLLRADTHFSISKYIGSAKSFTARILKEEGYVTNCRKGSIWSPSYCLLTTGGAPIDVIRRYIENQGKKNCVPKGRSCVNRKI